MEDKARKRLDQLARRAKMLDDVIQKAAAMQKRIVAEIQRLGHDDRLVSQRATRTPKSRKRINAKKRRN